MHVPVGSAAAAAAGGSVRREAAGELSPRREPAAPPAPTPPDTLALHHLVMEHFIETVKKYPCLWNTTAIEYRDQELKDAAWAEVMKETNLASVKDVKLKWKKLRDSYRDALKRQSEMLARDPHHPAKRTYPWKYMSLMQFLQPHMNNRKKPQESPYTPPVENGAGETHNGDPHTSDDSDSEPDSSPKRKSCDQLTVIDRKLDYLCKAQSKRQCADTDRRRDAAPPAAAAAAVPATPDPLDIFFNSMCQSTKRLPYPTQIKIKKVLFGAVVEAEEALLAEQASYASLWAAEAGSSSSSDNDDDDQKAS